MNNIDAKKDSGLAVFAQQVEKTISLLEQHDRHWIWGLGKDVDKLVMTVGNQSFVVYDPRLSSIDIIVHRDLLEATEDSTLLELQQVRQYKENPKHIRVRIPIAQASQALESLADAHTAALPLKKSWFRINQRWKSHRDDVRQMLGEYLPSPLAEPGYIDQWRELKLQQKLNTSLDPEVASPSLIAARQMAATILAAHKLSPESWAVFPSNGNILINVGQVTAGGSKSSGKYDWVLSRELLDSDVITQCDAISVSKIPRDYDSLVFPQLGDDGSPIGFDSFVDAHEAALTKLTDPYKRATLWQTHRESLRHRIEEVSGIDLPEPGYLDELPSPNPTAPVPPESYLVFPVPAIQQALAKSGLSYTRDQVSAYYVGLQTKGFVVLSGISGTGKSKIATGFVGLLPKGRTSSFQAAAQPDHIPLTVKPYMQKYRRVIFPKKSLDLLPPLAVGEQREIQLTLGDIQGSGRIEHRAHPSGSSTTVLYFRGSVGNAIAALEPGSRLFAEPVLDADGDRLASIRLTTEQGLEPGGLRSEPVSNHLFLSVRPDWRDSTSLLGYYNPLTASYEWTDFLRFILQAAENYKGPAEDRIAWFVILDEMNLAHVEYYFADLLSVIESGRDADGWTGEPLRFTYPETLEDDEVPPREVKLPPNLYLIGTVNMDETTHAFSPKVLDRAFTIELTDVTFENYPPTASDPDNAGALGDDQKRALLQRFSRNGEFARIDKAEIAAFVAQHPEVRRWLQALNTRLATYRLHFGYRVFDEIVQYLANNESDAGVPLQDAFDQAVLMKVLPKFTGSRARLEDPLRDVLLWTINPNEADLPSTSALLDHWNAGAAIGGVLQASSVHRTAKRVADMLTALDRDGFVSFG